MSGVVFKLGVAASVVAVALGAAALGLGFFLLGDDPPQIVSSGQREATFDELTRGEPVAEAWREEPTVETTEQMPSPDPPETEESKPDDAPEPDPPEPDPPEPDPSEAPKAEPEPQPTLVAEGVDWPAPEEEEVRAANGRRDYGDLPSGAVLGLTIDSLGLYSAPVWKYNGDASLDKGVAHIPETSLPWSDTPERNTFLAGHRIGYPGTESRLLFYNLPKIKKGDRVVLNNARGKKYTYEVSETFTVTPYDSWVLGRVRGRDMITLQTCTPIPTFEKRLIVRADRV